MMFFKKLFNKMPKSYFLMKSEPDVWSIDQQKKLVLKVLLGME